MTEPMIATGRISIPYTVSGITHTCRAFVKNITWATDHYNINSRTSDANDLLWSDAAQGLADTMTCLLQAADVLGSAKLEEFYEGVWMTRAVAAVTNVNGAGSVALTSQVTIVLRDNVFKLMKFTVLDTTQVAPQHWLSPTGGNASMDLFCNNFQSAGAIAHKPYLWAVSREEQYIDNGGFVGVTVALNRRVRRRRGLT